ncbi:MAG: hypothetical protein ABWY63_01685 [Hyphomicrobiaceae bacterium]
MVVSAPNKPAPARDYPNMNALQAIRFNYDSTPLPDATGQATAPSSGLRLNVAVPVGTIPAKSYVLGMTWHVANATTAASTLDVGTAAAPTRFLAAGALNAISRNDAAASACGYIGDVDTPILATLKVSADLSDSAFSFVIYYYPKGD